jgi:resuscitation-promoting factor RpfB
VPERKDLGLIGRGPLRVSHVLAVSILCAGFVCAGFFTKPSSALAAASAAVPASARAPQATTQHAVTFASNGTVTQHVTDAATVGDFLHERNITVGEHDYVNPSIGVPLSDGLVVTYRAAVTVTIQTARQKITTVSAAEDVGALLEERHVTLGANDRVRPSLSDPLPANGVVRIVRVLTWERHEKRSIAAQTIHRLDFSMTPGTTRTISKGAVGERDVMVRFSQRDGGAVRASVIASHVTRKPKPRVIAEGVDEYQAFARFEARGVERTAYIARSALQMVATAYTASCSGCSGITAIGRRAGHGIVAVDPRVIPLGTRLFIPGYGPAIAGDTGGAIHGLRIDLGFNSLRDAMLFGRREVTVYRLK